MADFRDLKFGVQQLQRGNVSARVATPRFNAFNSSTDIAAAGWADKISGPLPSDPVGALFKSGRRDSSVTLAESLALACSVFLATPCAHTPPSSPPSRELAVASMTKGQTSKMEARKKKNKAAAAQRRQRPLPAGWIQGDFLPSTVTEGDLLELVEHGMLVHKSQRLRRTARWSRRHRGSASCSSAMSTQSDDKTHLLQLCGGLGFQKKSRSSYPALQLSESVRNWQSTWFYCQDIAYPNASTGLPSFSLDRPAPPKQLALSKAEKNDIQPLVEALVDVVRRGVTGIDLLEIFLGRRIQPLHARDHAMWHYGPSSTRTNVVGVPEERVTSWVLQITGPCENPKGARRVKPYSADNPPLNQAWTIGSPVSSRIRRRRKKAARGVEARIVSNSGEAEEDSEEEEEAKSGLATPAASIGKRRQARPFSSSCVVECSFAARLSSVEAPRGQGALSP
ncbi:hypothetical protein ZWY2020_011652 [Hordeum vulgare]|nr:hypothetical protein ZWY2020_011652 [Hordeum vulgare]